MWSRNATQPGWQDMYTYAGSAFGNMDHATQGLDRGPTWGGRPTSCWSGNKMCECYEWTGCSMVETCHAHPLHFHVIA